VLGTRLQVQRSKHLRAFAVWAYGRKFKPPVSRVVVDFRNSLIHRYWAIDDEKLVENIKNGLDDFERFADEIEVYLQSIRE